MQFIQSPLEHQPSDQVLNHNYPGHGTESSPYIVSFLPHHLHDTSDPHAFSLRRKWVITMLQASSTFVVTFASSVYASGIPGIMHHFPGTSAEVATLGLSLYVLGFSAGPMVWAPLSEVYGRRVVYVVSFTGFVIFSAAAIGAGSIPALLVLRFLSSAFGSSVMTNSGGVISDMFSKTEMGIPMGLFVMMPFLGPGFGPIVGGFLAEVPDGWRWILVLIAILGFLLGVPTMLVARETYAPVLLRRRARALSRVTGKVYVSHMDAGKPAKTLFGSLHTAFTRPWILLLHEPIVLLTSLYVAIIYGTLYMFFPGFAIVFEEGRDWSSGQAGLPFIGVVIGVCLATAAGGMDNKRYVRLSVSMEAKGGEVQAEARLPPALVGSVVLPVGLFLFAFTTYPSVHWFAPVMGGLLFAFGFILVFVSLLSYVIDTYIIYAASALAANSMLRSLLGCAFPLFTTQMYETLGYQWASSVPAFLTLACLPFPFLFYRYGRRIRARCKFAAEAAEFMAMMKRRSQMAPASTVERVNETEKEAV